MEAPGQVFEGLTAPVRNSWMPAFIGRSAMDRGTESVVSSSLPSERSRHDRRRPGKVAIRVFGTRLRPHVTSPPACCVRLETTSLPPVGAMEQQSLRPRRLDVIPSHPRCRAETHQRSATRHGTCDTGTWSCLRSPTRPTRAPPGTHRGLNMPSRRQVWRQCRSSRIVGMKESACGSPSNHNSDRGVGWRPLRVRPDLGSSRRSRSRHI